jgi:hypothetical protein
LSPALTMSTANPPYNARFLMPSDLSTVKASVLAVCDELLTPLLESASAGTLTVRAAEEKCWQALLPLGAALLTAMLGALCRATSERCASERGWSLEDGSARYRLDDDYTAHLSSTFGPVAVPLFAMRTPGPGSATVTPARKLFPHYPQMRSSELLVEWECALAADHPFRKAAEALLFFSHGAADIEDTTIERHAVAVGKAIPSNWLYRTPADIRKVLRERAAQDLDTGLPIIYASTDAHALKRFVDDKWNPKWKMTNGIRVWTVDKKSGETIHLGGQYTWGDCLEVRRCFQRLQQQGVLPADGDYGEGVLAQVAFVTDGLDWIAEYVLPLYPDAVTALDPYHVLQHVAEAAKKASPEKKNEKTVKAVVAKARRALGMRTRRERLVLRKSEPRKQRRARRSGYDGSGERLLDEVLRPLLEAATRGKTRIRQAIAYVERNLYRLDYGELRTRGFQIGSGAMESLHRTGSQVRLKRAGCHWTAEAAQAILNLRMLGLSTRWREYWAQPVLPHLAPAGGAS